MRRFPAARDHRPGDVYKRETVGERRQYASVEKVASGVAARGHESELPHASLKGDIV